MGETEKPFACTSEGCHMSFTNEDHLNIHQKKHDMVLNLGLINKNSSIPADQTPTPTRFIRNCEEVGLFQDLQNVNPFDETFKKAVETGKKVSLLLPEANVDDTLHTPQIYPLEPGTSFQSNNDFSMNEVSVLEDDSHLLMDIKEIKNEGNTNEAKPIVPVSNNGPLQSLEPEVECTIDTDSSGLEWHSPSSSLKRKAFIAEALNAKILNRSCNVKQDNEQQSNLEKKRACNRAAQIRSRKKKKFRQESMEKEIMELRTAKTTLLSENEFLKKKIKLFQSLLSDHQNCSVAQDPKIKQKVQQLLNFDKKPKDSSAVGPNTSPTPKLIPIKPQTVKNIITVVPGIIATLPTIQTVTTNAKHATKSANDSVTISKIPSVVPLIQNVILPSTAATLGNQTVALVQTPVLKKKDKPKPAILRRPLPKVKIDPPKADKRDVGIKIS